jgi:uncharacterized membrane protein YhaH (DUF805 family)
MDIVDLMFSVLAFLMLSGIASVILLLIFQRTNRRLLITIALGLSLVVWSLLEPATTPAIAISAIPVWLILDQSVRRDFVGWYVRLYDGDLDRREFLSELVKILFAFIGYIMLMTFPYFLVSSDPAVKPLADAVYLILAPPVLLAIWAYTPSLAVRRARSAGRSPWWTVLILAPYVNLAYFIYLSLAPPKIASTKEQSEAKHQPVRYPGLHEVSGEP